MLRAAGYPVADEHVRQIVTQQGERVPDLDAIMRTPAEVLAATDARVDSFNVPFGGADVAGLPTTPGLQPRSPEVNYDEMGGPHEGTKLSRWVRLGEAFCTICCGAEKSEDGFLHPRVIPSSMDGPVMGYSRGLHVGL